MLIFSIQELTRLRKAFEAAKKGGAAAPGGAKKGKKSVKGKEKAGELLFNF